MPETSLDSMESTLQQLKEIVEKNHAAETAQIVRQMERLVAEMKSREKSSAAFANSAGTSFLPAAFAP